MSSGTGFEEVLARLEQWENEVRSAVYRVAESIATLVQEYAKTHHPWVSRTGNTEASTNTFVSLKQEVVEIVLVSRADYARFLELARGGRWAWLWEAISANEEAIKSLLVAQLGEVLR